MRIVCWNMHLTNGSGQFGNIRDFCTNVRTKLGADVFIALEPPRGLHTIQRANTGQQGGYIGFIVVDAYSGERSDKIVVCSTYPITQVARELPEGQQAYVLSFTANGRRIATFHAPYDDANATTYIAKAFVYVNKMSSKPDVVIGDYNTHGATIPSSAAGYSLAMHAATGSNGTSDPLDKISLRGGVTIHKCGRLYHSQGSDTMNMTELPVADRTSGNVEDKSVSWVPLKNSDHIAIYVDLTDDATPATASSSSHSEVKPGEIWKSEIDTTKLLARIADIRNSKKTCPVLTPELESELSGATARLAQLKRNNALSSSSSSSSVAAAASSSTTSSHAKASSRPPSPDITYMSDNEQKS